MHATGDVISNGPCAVIDLVAVGQMDDLLAVEGLPIKGQNHGIADDIIEPWRSDRARIAR